LKIHKDDPYTGQLPEIVRFLNDCDDLRGERLITVADTQTRAFTRYWPTMIIHKWDPDKQDFLYTFWGTGMVEAYGMELTGKYIKRGEFLETEQVFFDTHSVAMTEQRAVFLRSEVFWLSKNYKELNAVIIPLKHRGGADGTLSYVTFS
jgi:hypothetical protein